MQKQEPRVRLWGRREPQGDGEAASFTQPGGLAPPQCFLNTCYVPGFLGTPRVDPLRLGREAVGGLGVDPTDVWVTEGF